MKNNWKYTLLALPIFVSSCTSEMQSMFNGPPGIQLPGFQSQSQQAYQNRPTITAQGGETLAQLALRHGIDPQSLSAANNMQMQTILRSNQRLVLPVAGGANQYVDMAQNAEGDLPTVRDSQNQTAQSTWNSGPGTQQYAQETAGSTQNVAQAKPKPQPTTPPPSSNKKTYSWPVKGKVTKGYSPSDPSIVIAAPPSTAVKAAQSGTVIHAGDVTNYGNTVLVRHDDGKLSLYGYNDTLLVKKGDTVSKGQVISRVGESGNATSPSLIYELRNKDGKSYENPADYFQ